MNSIWVKTTLFTNLVLISFTFLGRSLSPASNEKPFGAGIIWSGYSVLQSLLSILLQQEEKHLSCLGSAKLRSQAVSWPKLSIQSVLWGYLNHTQCFVVEGREVPIKLSFTLRRNNTNELQISVSKAHQKSYYSFSQGGKCPGKFSHCRTALIMVRKSNWTKKHKIIHANLVVPNIHSFNGADLQSNQHIKFSIQF